MQALDIVFTIYGQIDVDGHGQDPANIGSNKPSKVIILSIA
jgi:hypothetical protein